MARPPIGNGSVHHISLLVGQLQGQVAEVSRQIEHVNNNIKMRDDSAQQHREVLRQEVAELRHEAHETKTVAKAVEQDVAEMKNDMADQKEVMDSYVRDRPIAVAAFKTVDELQMFMKALKEEETYNRGFWAGIFQIGKMGWVAISALVVAIFAIFLQYGMPYLLEILGRS